MLCVVGGHLQLTNDISEIVYVLHVKSYQPLKRTFCRNVYCKSCACSKEDVGAAASISWRVSSLTPVRSTLSRVLLCAHPLPIGIIMPAECLLYPLRLCCLIHLWHFYQVIKMSVLHESKFAMVVSLRLLYSCRKGCNNFACRDCLQFSGKSLVFGCASIGCKPYLCQRRSLDQGLTTGKNMSCQFGGGVFVVYIYIYAAICITRALFVNSDLFFLSWLNRRRLSTAEALCVQQVRKYSISKSKSR